MPARRRKPGTSGRVTPKGGPSKPSPERPAGRRPPSPDTRFQVGRQPSNPLFLLIVGLLWIAVGVIIMVAASFSWRFILGIVAIGIGLFFIRGAGSTVVRREQRRSDD
jgi:hypothetical protein